MDQQMISRLLALGMSIDDALSLRRASMTLSRWAELECGDGNNFASWGIKRDEATDLPYMVTYPHNGKPHRTKIADKEKGALKRIAAICTARRLHFYHQTDPRGAALYVSREPLTATDYPKGVAVYK